MFGNIFGTRASHYNPDEPRDWHGRWTTGGSSWRNNPLRDPSPVGRARTFLGHGLAGAFQQGVIRTVAYPTQAEGERFSRLLAVWRMAAGIDDETFREHFANGLNIDAKTLHRLRQAVAGAAEAQTIGQIIEASYPLTAAIKAIGADRWPGVLEDLEDRAESVMPTQLAALARTTSDTARTGLVAGDKTDPGKIVLAAGTGEREELDPDPLAELRLADYNDAMAALRRFDPYNPQLVTLTGPNYRPDAETIRRLWNEVRLQQENIAYRISQGHGYDGPDGHAYQFGRPGKPCTRDEYYNRILRVIRDPSVTIVPLKRGRTAFYQDSTNTLVIVDPRSSDRGTMYKPDAGRAALSRLE